MVVKNIPIPPLHPCTVPSPQAFPGMQKGSGSRLMMETKGTDWCSEEGWDPQNSSHRSVHQTSFLAARVVEMLSTLGAEALVQ